MEEMWKQIEGFPDYDVSTLGRIRSWRTNKTTPVIRKLENNGGYHYVSLMKPGEPKKVGRKVHRLVAQAFIPNPDNLPEVAHKDGNPEHNTINDLRWSTHGDNMRDKVEHRTLPLGEKHHASKLTTEIVIDIRSRHAAGESMSSLARACGICVATMFEVIHRKTWTHC